LDDSIYQQWEESQAQSNRTSMPLVTSDIAPSDSFADAQTLSDLIVYAKAHNPSIHVARHHVEQAQHGIAQTTSLDDPMFTLTPIGEMAQTADGQVTLMTSLSQKLPLSDKLTVRGDVARLQVQIATEQLRQTELSVTRDIRQVYWRYQLANDTLDVLHQQQKLMQQLNESANAAYQAGRTNQQDLLRITVEISSLENRITSANQQSKSALARMNSLLNRPASAPLSIVKPSTDVQESISLVDWQKRAYDKAPQVQIVKTAIQQARMQLKLSHLKRIPDLTVMLNYAAVSDHGTSMAADGTDQLYAGFGINLPIWQDKLDAAEKQALAKIHEQIARLVQINNQLQFDITDAYERVESQRKQDALYQSTILPQAQQAVDSALSQYQAGRGNFINLIDNWRKLLEIQLMAHRNHSLLQQDIAQLQYLASAD
jgi:outer membrane protein TolC